MLGTVVNVATVLVGGLTGLLLKNRLSEKHKENFFQLIGVFTFLLGIKMGLSTQLILIPLVALVLGVFLGGTLNLEKRFDSLSKKLANKLGNDESTFSKGLMTAFLIFCIGPMTIMGAIEDGLGMNPDLLYTKSAMDGVTAAFLSASLGVAVVFSAIPLLIFQGGITLMASTFERIMSEFMMSEFEAVGGLMLCALALNILNLKKIELFNWLPALIFAPILAWCYSYFGGVI